ncbi:eukaryotic translation initiation factor 3 subunit J [Sitophilus oryzae]|uniref:Eukaryotic translation initiation factor 3 subunit J n=1 Tax=Sitophilus oryzae TaxID=7048 RepID=A0A6J2YUA8_SITOR|nr:eukaryotic translation initiation factor 3 subunit J [Sitophilus oryzae]
MESWDDEDFEPPTVTSSLVKSNKWEGEDEDEDVKESWEDEDDEKKEEDEDKKVTDAKKSKKKNLAEKIAEKERLKQEELERRLKEQQELSPEEKLRMQKESDLKLALETTFGEKEDEEIGGLKLPSTKEEFEEFTNVLSKKLSPLSKHPTEFVNFTEELARNLCASMNSADIKKIKNTLDNLYLEKQKIEKGDKNKKTKGKGKAKLKLEGDKDNLSAYVNDYTEFDVDYDDFM